ncbi:MAG: magnesium transporter [Actinomycetota bacterium]|nr:magnesium transporter [Actinomycetota bacterium]
MFSNGPAAGSPTLPEGWPIGSYDTYDEAQRAVNDLAGADFPVRGVSIVGVDLMLVERVDARLTWGRVLSGGAMSGASLGLFVGLLLTLTSTTGGMLPLLLGLGIGVAFGVASAALRTAATRGRRGFVSHSQFVARRYDVLCVSGTAERGRDLLATSDGKRALAGRAVTKK